MKNAHAANQLGLFESETSSIGSRRALLQSITWSYSRRSTFERCALRYYFQYFGANTRLAKAEPDKEELRLLKSVSSRHERTGSILHLAIAWCLRAAQRGEEPSTDRLVGWARRLFVADRAYSRLDPDGLNPDHGSRFPPVLLREYHYRQPDAEQLCEEAEQRLLDALRTFATDQSLNSLRLAGATPGALLEHPMRLHQSQIPCRVGGRIDLAYKCETSATVADWKLGIGDGTADDSLQLAAYALWAVEHFACDPSALRVCKVHLSSREVTDFPANAAVLRLTRARIVQDAERMAAVQAYGEAGVAVAFSPCAQPAVCNSCPFQRICPEGKQFIDA